MIGIEHIHDDRCLGNNDYLIVIVIAKEEIWKVLPPNLKNGDNFGVPLISAWA